MLYSFVLKIPGADCEGNCHFSRSMLEKYPINLMDKQLRQAGVLLYQATYNLVVC